MDSTTTEGFTSIWIGGNKFIVGFRLADALTAERRAHQVEHDEMIRLQERVKALQGQNDILTAQLEAQE